MCVACAASSEAVMRSLTRARDCSSAPTSEMNRLRADSRLATWGYLGGGEAGVMVVRI